MRQHAIEQDRVSNFRELAENIQDVFYDYDIERRRMLYVSPAYETVWGRSRSDGHAHQKRVKYNYRSHVTKVDQQ